jgi:hypothetical protein
VCNPWAILLSSGEGGGGGGGGGGREGLCITMAGLDEAGTPRHDLVAEESKRPPS